MWRRVGDYRQWEPGYSRSTKSGRRWAGGYELWESLDVRDLDVGLVEDRVEKLVREAENKYLLLDNRAKRIALAVPSDLPRPLLSIILRRLFEGLQAASVTLLPSSIMACVGAGVRSALVVDLGWYETTVNAVFEYREIHQERTVRAGKMMTQALRKRLRKELDAGGWKHRTGFEEVEEVLIRAAWCRSKEQRTEENGSPATIEIPFAFDGTETRLQIPFQALSEPAETSFFAHDPRSRNDDHEHTIPQLLYHALLQLPVDMRNVCLSHIIFTGGISQIPGLKQRILEEAQDLVDTHGWDPIRTYAPRLGLSRPSRRTATQPDAGQSPSLSSLSSPKVSESTTEPPSDDVIAIPAHARLHDTNPIDTKLASLALNATTPTPPAGTLRAVHSLGAWAGASLVTNLRIKGVVEIERERFASHGLVGGAVPGSVKPGVVGPAADSGYGGARARQSLGPGVKLGEKSAGWGLGVWA
jgi:actin-related protein